MYYKGFYITRTAIYDPPTDMRYSCGEAHWMTAHHWQTSDEDVYEYAVRLIDKYLKERI